jgi:hypothetical protein
MLLGVAMLNYLPFSASRLLGQGSYADLGILGEGFRMVVRGVIRGYPRLGNVHGHGDALNSLIPFQQPGIQDSP